MTPTEKALFELAQCPFPLHDYISKETWEFVCQFVIDMKKKLDDAKEGINPPGPWRI